MRLLPPPLRAGLLLLFLAPLVMGQSEAERETALGRGQEISNAVSSVTSTSISPLLGVCIFGAYQYARTPESERARLPFFARPRVWVSLMILLALIFLKDTIGGSIPLLKKPLDALEVLVVNKASLVLLAIPFMFDQVLPLAGLRSVTSLISLYEPVVYAEDASGWHTAGRIGMATLLVTAGLFVTVVVWLIGHAIDVLVLLSPFPFVDVFFKGIRTAILLAILIPWFVDRRAGLIVALIVIAIAILLFAKALRLAILGSIFAWDLIRLMVFGRHERPEAAHPIVGFTAGNIHGLPSQAFGTLERSPSGILEFRTRRLGFGPTRRVRLEDAVDYEVGRGMLYPCITLPQGSGYALQFRLPPRYNGIEEWVQSSLGMSGIRDIRLRKGLKAFWRWIEGNAPLPREA